MGSTPRLSPSGGSGTRSRIWRMGPKHPHSTVLTEEQEAVVVAFRKQTLLPLDDCLYALQATIPRLTRSALHRCFQRHGISRLPDVEGDKPAKKKFRHYPIGYFHIDIAEVRTEQGKLYLFVAIDRTSKFAFASTPRTRHATNLGRPSESLDRRRSLHRPYRAHQQRHTLRGQHAGTGLDPGRERAGATSPFQGSCFCLGLRAKLDPTPPHPTETSMDQWTSRAHEPDSKGCYRQTVLLPDSSATQRTSPGVPHGLQLRQTT